MTTPLNTYRQLRLEKAQNVRELGFDPYPSTTSRTHEARVLVDGFADLSGKNVTVAGRIMSWRHHRNLVFADLQDQSGRIQLMLTGDNLRKTDPDARTLGFEDAVRLIDIGDIIEAEGGLVKTRRGETSVDVHRIRILSMSLRPLPDKWNKVTDEETLTRQRYLDMIMSPEKRNRFAVVSEILFAIRSFLRDQGFLEFNTPVLQPLYGGGRAKPFKTHLNALSTDYFLAISHELYLKRLVIAGFERVYTIGRYFRNEGIDRTHNPEFSMLETMSAFEGYEFNMDLTERLYKHLARDVVGRPTVESRGQKIHITGEWKRSSMSHLILEQTGLDFNSIADITEANNTLFRFGLPPEASWGHAMASLFEEHVAPKLIQPTIVYGHPVEISPLAKASADDPRFVERFELFINGTEQGDNWSELNDPEELRRRFAAEQTRRQTEGDDEAHPLDVEFLEAMEFGMPPTTGVGPGIERLAMLLTDAEAISDVAFFPLLRPRSASEFPDEASNSSG